MTVIDRHGRENRDQVDVVLTEIENHRATRLVVGVRPRTPVGKAVLGSVSQQLVLHSPAPVLSVKVDD